MSNKCSFGKQNFIYFIAYKDNKEIRLLCSVYSIMSVYKRYSDKTKCVYFMIKDKKVWEKVSNIIKKNS